jgi:hypothetical protein
MIHVFRGRRVAAKTRADLSRLAAASDHVLIHAALIVGLGDQTVEALPRYRPNDHHGVLVDIAPGPVTVCIAERAPESPVTCKSVDVPRLPPTAMRDGHGVYPTIPVELVPASR